MTDIDKILQKMRINPQNIKFSDLCKICDHYFGKPRQKGTSHRIYKVPWVLPPLRNIQGSKGKAKPYQVKQVLEAIDCMEEKQ